MRNLKIQSFIILGLILTACGGGSGADNDSTPKTQNPSIEKPSAEIHDSQLSDIVDLYIPTLQAELFFDASLYTVINSENPILKTINSSCISGNKTISGENPLISSNKMSSIVYNNCVVMKESLQNYNFEQKFLGMVSYTLYSNDKILDFEANLRDFQQTLKVNDNNIQYFISGKSHYKIADDGGFQDFFLMI